MSFLRKHWSGHGTLQSDRKTKTTDDGISEKLEMPDVTSTAAKNMEKPPEKNNPEERKNSPRIHLQPTRPEIKATIAQYGRPGSNTDTSTREEDKPFVPRRIGDPPGYIRTVVSEKRTEILNERPNWNAAATEESGSEGDRSSESMFQSTLFIRQNARETFECSVLCEPNLPSERHMLHSRRSDEIYKKCKKVNKRPINYRVADGRKDEIVQTCKSVSEPTWNERKKILQQQQLQDNINNILEQFMYLEAEDIIDLALSQGKLTEYKKKNQLQISQKSSAQGLRELSREVSPQVLVNIKPFKEQVSDDLLTVEQSSAEPKLSKQFKREVRNEERRIRSIPKSRSTLLKSEETSSEVKSVGGTSRPNINFQRQSTTMINKKSASEEPYLRPNSDMTPKTPTCTVWGVYKSYSACKNAVEVRGRKKEKKQTQTEERGKVKLILKSFDEVLDLDDSDHDVVFQKNISQFRKKITSELELDENYHPINPSKTRLKRFVTSERTKEGKIERFRLEDMEQWKGERKPGRVLENVCLVLSEAKLLGRILETRIEAGAIRRSQKAREIRDMVESNSSTVVEKEVPICFEGNLETLGMPWKDSEKLSPFVLRNQRIITGAFAIHGISAATMHEFGEPKTSLSEILKASPNSAKCCYVLPEKWFFELLQKHESSRNGLNVGGKWSKSRLQGKQKEEKEKDVPRKKKKGLILFEPFLKPPCRVVQILNCSSYSYGIITFDPEYPSASVSTLWNAQTSEVNVGEKTSESSSRAFVGEASAATYRETVNSAEALTWATENASESDSCFDGFQIIYNNSKESIIDDEDDPTKPVFLGGLNERKRSCIISPEESPSSTANKKTNTARGGWSGKGRMTKSPDSKESRALKFKSNSSPKETVPQLDFVRLGGHRPGRSLILSKEAERDCLDFRKKKPGLDKEVDIRRTALTPSAEKDFANADSLPFQKSETCSESEDRCVDRKKTFVVEKTASSYRKEIVSAFNSIKELSSTKGEVKGGNRRMSLVIMLSKK